MVYVQELELADLSAQLAEYTTKHKRPPSGWYPAHLLSFIGHHDEHFQGHQTDIRHALKSVLLLQAENMVVCRLMRWDHLMLRPPLLFILRAGESEVDTRFQEFRLIRSIDKTQSSRVWADYRRSRAVSVRDVSAA